MLLQTQLRTPIELACSVLKEANVFLLEATRNVSKTNRKLHHHNEKEEEVRSSRKEVEAPQERPTTISPNGMLLGTRSAVLVAPSPGVDRQTETVFQESLLSSFLLWAGARGAIRLRNSNFRETSTSFRQNDPICGSSDGLGALSTANRPSPPR